MTFRAFNVGDMQILQGENHGWTVRQLGNEKFAVREYDNKTEFHKYHIMVDLLRNNPHPNVPKIVGFGSENPDGKLYILTEYPSQTVSILMESKRIPVHPPFSTVVVFEYLTDVCTALEYLHDRDISSPGLNFSTVYIIQGEKTYPFSLPLGAAGKKRAKLFAFGGSDGNLTNPLDLGPKGDVLRFAIISEECIAPHVDIGVEADLELFREIINRSKGHVSERPQMEEVTKVMKEVLKKLQSCEAISVGNDRF